MIRPSIYDTPAQRARIDAANRSRVSQSLSASFRESLENTVEHTTPREHVRREHPRRIGRLVIRVRQHLVSKGVS